MMLSIFVKRSIYLFYSAIYFPFLFLFLPGALLVLTTLICWMPYLLVHSNYIRVSEGHWFGVFTMLLGYTNAIWDPLIYTFINKRARKECKKYFGYIAPFSRRSMNGSVVKQN